MFARFCSHSLGPYELLANGFLGIEFSGVEAGCSAGFLVCEDKIDATFTCWLDGR